jgi:hypothetical protein
MVQAGVLPLGAGKVLPAKQRADFARHLLLSLEPGPLDDPSTVERLWSEEVDARIDRADAGASAEEDWRSVIERVRGSLSDPNV